LQIISSDCKQGISLTDVEKLLLMKTNHLILIPFVGTMNRNNNSDLNLRGGQPGGGKQQPKKAYR